MYSSYTTLCAKYLLGVLLSQLLIGTLQLRGVFDQFVFAIKSKTQYFVLDLLALLSHLDKLTLHEIGVKPLLFLPQKIAQVASVN